MARNPGKDSGNAYDGADGAAKSKSKFIKSSKLIALSPNPGIGLPMGSRLTLSNGRSEGDGESNLRKTTVVTFPGVAAHYWLPTAGVCYDSTDGVNVAALKLYRQIQETLKQRSLPFDRAQTIMHALVLSGIVVPWKDLERALKVLNTHSKVNKYLGDNMLRALGWDPVDLLENRPAIESTLQKWKSEIEEIHIPKDIIPFLDIHVQLTDTLFSEGQTIRDQLHAFIPERVITSTYLDTKRTLDYFEFHKRGELMTWSKFKTIYTSILEAVTNSSDFDTINMAFASTFPESKYDLTIPASDEKYTIEYDEGMLYALKNANTVDIGGLIFHAYQEDTATVYRRFLPQESLTKGVLTCTPTIEIENSTAVYDSLPVDYALIDAPTDSVTSEYMTNALRWHTHTEWAYDADAMHFPLAFRSFGTEILTGTLIYVFNALVDLAVNYDLNPARTLKSIEFGTTNAAHTYDTRRLNTYRAFGYNPVLYAAEDIEDLTTHYSLTGVMPCATFDFVFNVSEEDMLAVHDNFIYSMYVEGFTGESVKPEPTTGTDK